MTILAHFILAEHTTTRNTEFIIIQLGADGGGVTYYDIQSKNIVEL